MYLIISKHETNSFCAICVWNLLYYGRAVDPTMLVAQNEIAGE